MAGIFQAAALVQQVAREGSPEPRAFKTSIHSIFQLDADSVEAVFGGTDGLRLGLVALVQQFGQQNRQRDVELTRYAASLVFLERRVLKRPDLLKSIQEGVQFAAAQAEYFSITHDNVIAKLADIYSNTISTLLPRIRVSGEPHHLQNPTNANRIRALLLAGIRATVLWRQLGGNRLRLLFSRGRILALAETILAELTV